MPRSNAFGRLWDRQFVDPAVPLVESEMPAPPEPQRVPEPQGIAESVISPYHPVNYRAMREHGSGTGNYTFRQRNVKLNFTLGWELEANHVPSRVPVGVEQIEDGSVDGDGAEFIVMPAVTKSPRYVLGLLKELVHAPRLNTNKSCGFHIHVSASNLSSLARMRQWAIATEHLALQVEDLAFKAVPDSRHGNDYCRRIVPMTSGMTFNAHKYNNSRRYHWLNTVEMFRPGGIRTIEVRLLGNTHRWKYLLAWAYFSMELARRGWEMSNKPFDVVGHVDALGLILKSIAKDIKPLEKKLEPIPQWVYDGLKTFGIESDIWDRPLARLTETEADLHGIVRPVYSDNQPEIETRRRDDEDEDDNSCGCGCGEDGSCMDYLHDNGDCDSSYCGRCHDNGDCAGLPSCDACIERAHDDGESCQRSRCGTCHPVRVNDAGTRTGRVSGSNGPVTSNSSMTIHASNVPADNSGVLSVTELQRAVDDIRNVRIDNLSLSALQNGMSAGHIVYDEAAHVSNTMQAIEVDRRVWISGTTGDFYQPPVTDPAELERRAYEMIDAHENALSADREHYRPRALTVAELERFNRESMRISRGGQ